MGFFEVERRWILRPKQVRLPHSAGDVVGQLYFQKNFLGGVLLTDIPKKISKFTENISTIL